MATENEKTSVTASDNIDSTDVNYIPHGSFINKKESKFSQNIICLDIDLDQQTQYQQNQIEKEVKSKDSFF